MNILYLMKTPLSFLSIKVYPKSDLSSSVFWIVVRKSWHLSMASKTDHAFPRLLRILISHESSLNLYANKTSPFSFIFSSFVWQTRMYLKNCQNSTRHKTTKYGIVLSPRWCPFFNQPAQTWRRNARAEFCAENFRGWGNVYECVWRKIMFNIRPLATSPPIPTSRSLRPSLKLWTLFRRTRIETLV